MTKEENNKAIVGRWFTGFWGEEYDPSIVDELAAPGPGRHQSLHVRLPRGFSRPQLRWCR